MNKVLILFVVLLLTSPTCWSEEAAAVPDKPSISTSQTVVVTAVVEAINHETRDVTLRGPEGKSVSFVASEEARNLDQVQVGDTVIAEYKQDLSIEVLAGDGAEPGVGGLSAMTRTAEGEMPGLAGVNSTVVTASVEEINLEANTFKLKGPNGQINEYVAQDPENLRKAAVGDLVVITYTEAVAITVQKTEAE
jgi:hypothetical protein